VLKENLTEKDAIEMFSNVVKAVKYAHGEGVFHRDIKSDNIIVIKGSNKIKIADFGTAAIDDRLDRTFPFFCTDQVGTPDAWAPERERGEEYDPKAVDIYALGILLRDMLRKKKSPFEILPYSFPPPQRRVDTGGP
jgi:serine/threonine protein kinase